ncbi:PRC-barrel domain-containing protein [Francisella tularensis]|uniref:PRC-barrel domain-containing protein n=2 Tax=Francisella tularensis TaxID=263 RepID=UPI0009E57B0D|nr:PRC-barrel domain-containing protein [Francisella tularensis]MDN9003203.1 PRC-barrel domain-containing protein [Francisella tularensis subsp. mediasiatica]MDN9006966.1 PRC-barrel domain-containing protein [Francisella tularensis subsp. mediasiatica]RZP34828.1 hypothetical protein EXW67_01410 [Francisella tularensis subsp. mediasiatica]RZP38601.1 hypothetical protein EXW69_01400 [Francisella tularensis subsp. mediasiatica]RZP43894.1 hypothetical protein EXW68_01385 [Francisella tularensis su
MMAFLLDIITFLQISFSTNIFRINYTNTGEVAYVVVSFGGFLGMGDKLFAFPIKAFKVDTANAQFKIKKTKEELEEAPGFDKNNWPETSSDYW